MQDRQAWELGLAAHSEQQLSELPTHCPRCLQGEGVLQGSRCKDVKCTWRDAAESSKCSEAGAECKQGSSRDTKALRPVGAMQI